MTVVTRNSAPFKRSAASAKAPRCRGRSDSSPAKRCPSRAALPPENHGRTCENPSDCAGPGAAGVVMAVGLGCLTRTAAGPRLFLASSAARRHQQDVRSVRRSFQRQRLRARRLITHAPRVRENRCPSPRRTQTLRSAMARPAAPAAGKHPHRSSKLLPGRPPRSIIERACDHAVRVGGSVTLTPLNEPEGSNKRARGGEGNPLRSSRPHGRT
ncbi:hypothetical protein MYCOZU1_02556 [Mycobacterium intracellulare subsp. chimaera]|nr:hypothetical protein MYCODSM44623_02433 [Mycobacterium intracellulare subsp. chimaera]ASL20979.1 hypothetical protein MYCOZU1_02556 [Mycobacterium intracellulare subsp. chimaera]